MRGLVDCCKPVGQMCRRASPVFARFRSFSPCLGSTCFLPIFACVTARFVPFSPVFTRFLELLPRFGR